MGGGAPSWTGTASARVDADSALSCVLPGKGSCVMGIYFDMYMRGRAARGGLPLKRGIWYNDVVR